MKVLMQIRPDTDKYPGGDFIQLLKTKEYLEQAGIEADISHSPKAHLKHYDIVHLFNVTRITDTCLFFDNAQKQGKKIVISPIYHSLKDMENFYRFYYKFPFLNIVLYLSLKEIFYPLRARSPFSLKSIFTYKNVVKNVLGKSHLLLPNSHMERWCIENELHVDNRCCIIPNAAELGTKRVNQERKEDMIVCVGRIEPRKNQNYVIKAFEKGLKNFPPHIELIFIGALNKSHKSYCEEFVNHIARISERVKYLGPQSHDKVLHFFKKARLSVLASFFETTGLVGLEALSCGTNVVITERGYTGEYFGHNAVYCNPYSVDSISEAMVRAFYEHVKTEEIEDLISKCSWKNAAALTEKAYKEVMDET